MYFMQVLLFSVHTVISCSLFYFYLFSHFDPNGSGWINYGEFVWAFYNKKALMRQWKTATKTLTAAQIMNKFNDADTNGDGVLGFKEFSKFLKFGMKLRISNDDIETLMDRFDHDKDGTLDLTEFSEFMEEEIAKFNSASETLRSNKMSSPVKKKLIYRPMTRTTRGHKYADAARDAPPRYDEVDRDDGDEMHPPEYDSISQTEEITEGSVETAHGVRSSLNDLPNRNSNGSSNAGMSLHHTTPGKLQGNSTISYGDRPKSAAATSTRYRQSNAAGMTATSSRGLHSSTTDQLPSQATRDRGGRIGPPTGIAGREKVSARSMINSFRSTSAAVTDTTASGLDNVSPSNSTNSVLWVNEILQKQADIESKLGHSYF